ncbi:hypothetical protein [Vibrio bathopelagicus]
MANKGYSYDGKLRETFNEVKEAAKNSEVVVNERKVLFGRKALWIYLTGISINHKGSEVDLGHYVKEHCKGDIDCAITSIDSYVSFLVSLDDLSELPFDIKDSDKDTLEDLTFLLRDLKHVVESHKTRPERYHKNKNPISQLFTTGYCIFCSMPATSKDKSKCRKHTRNSGYDSEIRALKRKLDKAFQNTKLENTFGKMCSLDQSTRLEGWAKHQAVQKHFAKQLLKVYEESPTSEGNKISENDLKRACCSLIEICRAYPHTLRLFDDDSNHLCSFTLSLNEPTLTIAKILSLTEDTLADRNAFLDTLTVLSREGQMILIREAGKMNCSKAGNEKGMSLIEKWNR